MTDLITREDLASRLVKAGWLISDVKSIMDEAFPPKFVPRVGQVVLCWDMDNAEFVAYEKFKAMSDKGEYICTHNRWDACRAQTAEEKGEL